MESNTPPLSPKTALVTGGAKGIGFSIAKNLVLDGVSVLITSRSKTSLEHASRELNKFKKDSSVSIYIKSLDIEKVGDCEELYLYARNLFERLDVLVLNAAYDTSHVGSIFDIPVAELDKTLKVNIRSQVLLLKNLGPWMRDCKDGTIILLGSAASRRGSVAFGAYALTKAAISNLTMSLASEMGHSNVRVICIEPAVVKTDMTKDIWEDPEKLKRLTDSYPLGRIACPEEIAALVVTLCGAAGTWMTGSSVLVDGGQMAAVACKLKKS